MTVSQKDALNLRLTCPTVVPRAFSLTDEKITIGRSSSCTIPINDRYLSREHAEIVRLSGEWFVSDKGSVNGTFLNGQRLSERSALRPGDTITIGDNEILVLSDDGPALSGVMLPNEPIR